VTRYSFGYWKVIPYFEFEYLDLYPCGIGLAVCETAWGTKVAKTIPATANRTKPLTEKFARGIDWRVKR